MRMCQTNANANSAMISFSNPKGRRAIFSRMLVAPASIIWLLALSQNAIADAPESTAITNGFPSVPEVLGGKMFENETEQDVYFLQAIHDRYASHWPDLLRANITLTDYTLSPEKLLRFVNELGEAMRGQNDAIACTNLALITSDPSFY